MAQVTTSKVAERREETRRQIARVATAAFYTIRSEADANGEAITQTPIERIRRAVEDIIGAAKTVDPATWTNRRTMDAVRIVTERIFEVNG